MVKEHLRKAQFFYDEMKELLLPLLLSDWGKKISVLLSCVFALLILFALYQPLQSIREYFFPTTVVQSHNDTAVDDTNKLINKIPDAHLFGNAAIQNGGFVPITSLHLKLVGIAKSKKDTASQVIITEGNGIGKVYAIGDSLPSGIRIYAINNSDVILENSGHLEKLPLQRLALDFQDLPKTLWTEDDSDAS